MILFAKTPQYILNFVLIYLWNTLSIALNKVRIWLLIVFLQDGERGRLWLSPHPSLGRELMFVRTGNAGRKIFETTTEKSFLKPSEKG